MIIFKACLFSIFLIPYKLSTNQSNKYTAYQINTCCYGKKLKNMEKIRDSKKRPIFALNTKKVQVELYCYTRAPHRMTPIAPVNKVKENAELYTKKSFKIIHLICSSGVCF